MAAGSVPISVRRRMRYSMGSSPSIGQGRKRRRRSDWLSDRSSTLFGPWFLPSGMAIRKIQRGETAPMKTIGQPPQMAAGRRPRASDAVSSRLGQEAGPIASGHSQTGGRIAATGRSRPFYWLRRRSGKSACETSISRAANDRFRSAQSKRARTTASGKLSCTAALRWLPGNIWTTDHAASASVRKVRTSVIDPARSECPLEGRFFRQGRERQDLPPRMKAQEPRSRKQEAICLDPGAVVLGPGTWVLGTKLPGNARLDPGSVRVCVPPRRPISPLPGVGRPSRWLSVSPKGPAY